MIKSIQILRGLAALLVVIYHAAPTDGSGVVLSEDSWLQALCSVGYIGVNLFFLISGFIMFYVTERQTSPWKFIGHRFIRIIPLYWIVMFFGHGLQSFTSIDAYKSMFFIPLSVHQPPSFGWSFWPVGWTLNYEMFFYLLFFASMFLYRYRYVAIFSAFAVLHIVFAFFAEGEGANSFVGLLNSSLATPAISNPYLCMILNPMILLFGGGILIGYLYKNSRKLPPVYDLMAFVCCAVGLAVYFVCFDFGLTGFMCALLLAAALSLERFLESSAIALKVVKPLVFMGTISYSIYLTHLIFIHKDVLTHLPVPGWANLLILLGLTTILSYITYLLIEVKLSGYLKRQLKL